MSEIHCYHCGLPVPSYLDLSVTIHGQPQPMCCFGCQAVAQAIVAAGLQDFYTYRTELSPTGQALVPDFLNQVKVYDNPTVQKHFVQQKDESVREAALILEGITCAACIWLNERHLQNLPGVLTVHMNYATHRAQVKWDDSQIHLSEILQAISRIGYLAHPYDPTQQQEILERERKQQLRRIGITGVLGMQVMMFSIALYAGDFYGMATEFRVLFYWINLFLTLPILLYCAQPFFKNAWRDLNLKRAGMDVPVALGISLAFMGSVWNTLTLSASATPQPVYYDSIAMFVFFLLTGRYFELIARRHSVQAIENLGQSVPTTATRLTPKEQETRVLVADLVVGDRVLVRPGEPIPADGLILKGQTSVDESLLTGESQPLVKMPGQTVIAGSVNVDNPLQIKVEQVGTDTVLSHILRLLERAQTEKPALTQLADQVASWFVIGVILLAVSVATYWWQVDPTAWLTITLSMLVVTCPCALSLATPTAITAATSVLTRTGLLITRGSALETLAKATHFVFDKTGTLTEGKLRLLTTRVFSHQSEAWCLACAAALEQHSEHPISQVIRAACAETFYKATEISNHPGAGLQGQIDTTRYFIGTPAFIETQTHLILASNLLADLQQTGHTVVLLADTQVIHSAFVLGDQIRADAHTLVHSLQQSGKTVILLSGDQNNAVQRVADAVGIKTIGYALSPQDKLLKVKELQSSGAVVAMVGDGVNDAPVLAQAQVSIAMGNGTQIAKTSADMILLNEQLSHLIMGIQTAERMMAIIRQNITWAIGYNLLALPAAAMGWVTPWLAAIGMSFSSLLVVANALRLLRNC